MTHTDPPDFLAADPLAGTATAAGVAAFGARALAHGRARLDEIRRLADALDAEVTFAAVLGRLDEIQFVLRLVKGVGQVLGEAHADAAVRDEARAQVSRADETETEMFLDAGLAAVVKRVAARGPSATLDGPGARLLEHTLRQLRRNGLDLPPEGQAELRRLNAEISRLGQEFERNLGEAVGRIEVAPTALEGL